MYYDTSTCEFLQVTVPSWRDSKWFSMPDDGNAPRNYTIRLQHISEALITSGYTSLDRQAKALGVHRSTAWTIVNTKHKLDRLSTKTTKRILANPELPPSVRSVMQQYLAERPDALRRHRAHD
jgi:hypothetical protein